MLRVIDLDSQGKDSDGYVFVLTIGGERLGVTDQEILELVKLKYNTSRSTKKGPTKKGSNSETSPADANTAPGDHEPRSEGSPDQTGLDAASH